MRDPVYDGEVPVESEEQFADAVKRGGCLHLFAKPVRYIADPNTYWRCTDCGETMYAIPR
jgi:hypothetical protein